MSSPSTTQAETAVAVSTPARPRTVITWLTLAAGMLGLACALALPFAPVLVTQATVTWPAAGSDPKSTTAFFVPYTPAELHAVIPCPVLRGAVAGGQRVTVLATSGEEGVKAGQALVVLAAGGRLQIQLNGRQVTTVTPAATGCDVRVDATGTDTTVTAGTAPPIRLAGQVPQVHAFVTGLDPQRARGMTVRARARNWFEAAPTGLKLGLVAGHLLAAAGSLLLLWAAGRRRAAAGTARRGAVAGSGRRRWALAALVVPDAAVIAALGAWAVIGPMTADDGYAMMTIRNAVHSGDIGNYYHWYNASEAPFTLWQRIIGLVAPVSLAPVWLRLPSVVAGIATWFLVSRGLVGALLPRHARRPAVAALTAVAFLAWWLPFGLGIRPEPLVALGIAATFACLLWGTRPGAAAGGLPQLGLAAAAAGLSLSVTPSGILVFAPVLVMLPRLWRALTADLSGGSWRAAPAVAGRIAALAALAASGVTAMFFAQSLHGVRKATEVHDEIGPSLEWFQELVRYQYLLSTGNMGTATKRAAVLVSLALVVTMAVLVARHARAVPGLREVHLPTAVMAGAFLLLWLTPSKWSHHFGSMAGVGAAFLVVAVVTVVLTARHRGDRAMVAIGLAGGGLVALAAGLSFTGPNVWWHWSTYGLPWADGVPSPLDSPLLWALPPLLAAGVLAMPGGGGGRGARIRRALAAAPAVVAVPALLVSVLVLLVGFTWAPLRNPGTYTLGRQNIAHLTGSSCGLPDKVEVTPDLPGGALAPLASSGGRDGTGPAAGRRDPERPGGASGAGSPTGRDGSADRPGFAEQAGYPPAHPPTPGPGTGVHRFLWGSFVQVGGASGNAVTGTFTTPWFRLPSLRPGQELAVSVAGRIGEEGNSLALEFGRAGAAKPLGSHLLAVPGDEQGWRAAVVPRSAVPAGADQVRLRAVDGSTRNGGWLAFSGPRLREVTTLTDYLARRQGSPTLVNWEMAFTTPCVDNYPVVAHGLAQSPTTLIQTPGGALDRGIIFSASQGGSLYGATRTGRFTEVPSRLRGPAGQRWGRLVLIGYPFARDAYDVSLRTVRRPGWEGDR